MIVSNGFIDKSCANDWEVVDEILNSDGALDLRTPVIKMLADNADAIKNLKSILQDFENIHVMGEAQNGKVAVEQINSLRPDLLFLDISIRMQLLTSHPTNDR